jgi:hypothetical protein
MADEIIRRTKNYIAFDGDADLMSYRTMQGWSQDPKTPFEVNDAHELNYAKDDSLPESIINQLRERLKRSKNFLLIIGSETNKNRRGILQYEINYAIDNKLPIILIFKGHNTEEENDKKLWDEKLYPKIPKQIKDATEKYCLVSPFTRDVLYKTIQKYSNNNLPDNNYTWAWK